MFRSTPFSQLHKILPAPLEQTVEIDTLHTLYLAFRYLDKPTSGLKNAAPALDLKENSFASKRNASKLDVPRTA